MDLRFFNERLDIQKFELRCQNEGRSITRFECNGEVLLIQYSKLEDNERLVFRRNDFIYLDPPYAPENKKSFVGYTKDGFTYDNHLELFNKIKNLNIKFVMSNARVDLVLDNFKDCNVEDIKARRAINSKKPESKTTEVIVYN